MRERESRERVNERERGRNCNDRSLRWEVFFLVSCYMRFLLLPLPHVPFSNFINFSHSKNNAENSKLKM